MSQNRKRKVTVIPATCSYLINPTNVAIYCRVSTSHQPQLDSLKNQIDYFTNLVNHTAHWILFDTYYDIKSGRNSHDRKGLQRLLCDCEHGFINKIITKSISRFGRNTADTIAVLNRLRVLGVDVFFENENISLLDSSQQFILTLLEALAQAESESKSANIKLGIQHKSQNGTYGLFNRKCYGYKKSDINTLVIDEYEASIVKDIFNLYISGYSMLGIIKELKSRNIKSPTGNDTWHKATIEAMLSNEKYTGRVIIGKSICDDFPFNKPRRPNDGSQPMYESSDNHPEIISEELFETVQVEKKNRSNIILQNGKKVRKSTHYSMKSKCVDDAVQPKL